MTGLKWPSWKFGVRYHNGKVLFFKADRDGTFQVKANPGNSVVPSWAVDIREIIAMIFVGIGATALILQDHTTEAMYLLVGLFMYATGRTVPGGKQVIEIKKEANSN